MTRHLASTRAFSRGYSDMHPVVHVTDAAVQRPMPGGALRVSIVPEDQPNAIGDQPYAGMDPSAPATWVRPYNPQPGMAPRFNFDGAKASVNVPMGQTWRNPLYDRADVPPSKAQHLGRIRRRWGRR